MGKCLRRFFTSRSGGLLATVIAGIPAVAAVGRRRPGWGDELAAPECVVPWMRGADDCPKGALAALPSLRMAGWCRQRWRPPAPRATPLPPGPGWKRPPASRSLVEQATHPPPLPRRPQLGHHDIAPPRHERLAARMERATWRPIGRVRNRAGDRRQLHPRTRVDAWDRLQQRPGVGMLRI